MNITELKEQTVTETPVLLFDCELRSGDVERWSTHRVTFDDAVYAPRILRHNVFEIRSGAEEGIDAMARVSVTLANADSHFSQIERNTGWKGAKVTIRFAFFDLKQGIAASESAVLFHGVANPPDEITESTLRLTISNRLNLQRLLLPEVRVQRRCPWKFPSVRVQREEALRGGVQGKHSPFFRCGYSADVEGGNGNLNDSHAFASCDYTRAQCEERGMFSQDLAGNPTRRFGGIEFVPSTTLVRSYGEKSFHTSASLENETRYNDFVPLVYGTAWFTPLLVFLKNDGNLSHMEVLLGMGEMQGVLKVLVNGIEIPPGQGGKDMTATGWYNPITLGNRTGWFNADYLDNAGKPLGDPYGSMAAVSVVVPNRINDGRALPHIEVLAEGLKVSQFGPDGDYMGDNFSSSPAWILLDLLQRSGWALDEIDIPSFARAAAFCDEPIPVRDVHGNEGMVPRFQCNLVLRKRRSAADVIRGVRNSARLLLTYGFDGKLQLRPESTLALEEPAKPTGSNSTDSLAGGWPCYEFGDGSSGFSGILRRHGGEPSIRLYSRSNAETPNRVSVEFQDAFNDYQQDSLSLVDIDDVLATGQEITATLPTLGVANFSQAARLAKFYLDRSIGGNTYIEFETSVRGFGLRPGDLITVTYLKENLQRQLFRILRISPGMNFRTVSITAQLHRDEWYSDSSADEVRNSAWGRHRGISAVGPRPLAGSIRDSNGQLQFEITEEAAGNSDGGTDITLKVAFIAPAAPGRTSATTPLVSLAPRISTEGGSLSGDQTLFYAVTALDESGNESALSFLVRASIPPGTNTNTVTLAGLSFSPGTEMFRVYRGPNPSQLLRIVQNAPIAGEFADSGLDSELALPPDESYDHANFYWRLEVQPEYAATIRSPCTIGNTTLSMETDAYKGMAVRITQGQGAGQERRIVSNSQTTATVRPNWDVALDSSSFFVIAEAGWHFGAMALSSPVAFQIPNREGATVHVSGRAASVHDSECAYELSPLTRWRIAGGGSPLDAEVPPKPSFALMPIGEGTLEVSGIGFPALTNTRTVSAATIAIHYWDELRSPCENVLISAITEVDEFIQVSPGAEAQQGRILQVGSELLRVQQVLDGGVRLQVERGQHGTQATGHTAQAVVYDLTTKVFVMPFARDFFGSLASGNFSFRIPLPDARVASAELFATNMRGNSEIESIDYTSTANGGLRTFSGGQFAMQVDGYLGIQTNAAPPLVVQDSHSVRDISAIVLDKPSGGPIELRVTVDGAEYALLTIDANSTVSNIVNGFGLPPLAAGSRLGLDILAVPQENDSAPGRDLTVTIRM